jgi:hypothetical protein
MTAIAKEPSRHKALASGPSTYGRGCAAAPPRRLEDTITTEQKIIRAKRFHKTVLNEFYRVAFRKKAYRSIDELQADLLLDHGIQ